jgi:hypothetical protein
MGEHVAGQQLIAVEYLLSSRLVGDQDHQPAKPTADLLQAFNGSNGIVGRSHNPLVVLHHVVNYFLRRDIRHIVPQGIAEVLLDKTTAAQSHILNVLLTGLC